MLLMVFCVMSFSLLGQSIKTRTEKGVDLTNYETFTVMKGEFMTPPDMQKINEERLFQSIKKSVIKELELKGYKFLEDSSAQLYVSYVAGSYNLTDAGTLGPLSQSPASNPAEMNQSRSWTRESREGMMVIDIVDSSNKKELWKASGSLSMDNVDLNRALDAVIYRSFKKFPDKNKKKKK